MYSSAFCDHITCIHSWFVITLKLIEHLFIKYAQILTSHLSIYPTKTILYPLPSLAFLLNLKEKRLCSWFVQLLFSLCSLGGGRGPARGCTLVYIHSATHGILSLPCIQLPRLTLKASLIRRTWSRFVTIVTIWSLFVTACTIRGWHRV